MIAAMNSIDREIMKCLLHTPAIIILPNVKRAVCVCASASENRNNKIKKRWAKCRARRAEKWRENSVMAMIN